MPIYMHRKGEGVKMSHAEFNALRIAAEHDAALEVLRTEVRIRDREIKRLVGVNERMKEHRRQGNAARRNTQVVRLDTRIAELMRELADARTYIERLKKWNEKLLTDVREAAE